jgi:hypothetical protein
VIISHDKKKRKMLLITHDWPFDGISFLHLKCHSSFLKTMYYQKNICLSMVDDVKEKWKIYTLSFSFPFFLSI